VVIGVIGDTSILSEQMRSSNDSSG